MIRRTNLLGIFLIFAFLFTSPELDAAPARDTLAPVWSRTNGPMSYDITFLKCDSSNNLYAGFWGVGLAKSNNEGISWIFINNGLANLFVTCMEIDSVGNFYAGTNGSGIFKSTNSGLSWTAFNSGLTNLFIKSIAAKQGGPIFIGTLGGGVFRLKAGSSKWEQVNNLMWFHDINVIMVNKEGDVLAGTNGSGIYRSSDNGDNWTNSSGGLGCDNVTWFAQDDFAQIYCSTMGGGIYVSPSRGINWAVLKKSSNVMNIMNFDLNKKRDPVCAMADNGVARYDAYIYSDWRKTNLTDSAANCIVRMKNGNMFAALAFNGIYKSTNGGDSWILMEQNFKSEFGLNHLLARDGGLVFASKYDGRGLYISRDYGQSWTTATFPDTLVITAIGADSSGRILVGAMVFPDSINYLKASSDNGASWTNILTLGDSSIIAIGAKSGGIILLGLTFPPPNPKAQDPLVSEIMRSVNDGNNWTHLSAKVNLSVGFRFLKFNKKDGALFTRLHDGLYRSIDNGNSWTQILDQSNDVGDIDFDRNGNIYVGTDYGLKKSTNNGASWTTNNLGFSYDWKKRITNVTITKRDEIYIGFGLNRGVYRSDNGGTTFQDMGNSIVRAPIQGLATSPEGMIYLSTSGLYRTVEPGDMIVPSLVTPANMEGGVALNPTFTWNRVKKATMYEFQIARDPDFEFIQEHVTSGDTSKTLLRQLNNYEMYFWRVRSRFNNSLSDWSQVRQITTIIRKPDLISPPDNSNAMLLAFNLKWHSVAGAGNYKVQVSKEAGFGTKITDKEIKDTTFALTNLDLYTTYYWRVQAKSGTSFSDWSDVWSFTTKLSTPTLKSPANKSKGMDTIALLEWNEVSGANSFEVQIAKDSLFKVMIFEGETQTLAYHRTKLLEYFTTYYWRIRAKDDDGVSDWSKTWSFTTAIEAPLLVSPEDKYYNALRDSLKFEWKEYPAADYFQLEIAKDAGFTQMAYNDSTLIGTSHTVKNFAYNTQYWWKLRARKADNTGLWSETRTFTTGIAAPVLISPADNTTDAKTEIIFTWEAVDGASYYQIQIATDDNFVSKFADEDSLTDTRFNEDGLPYETKLYWRVLGQYQYGQSKWSETRNFTTQKKNSYVEDALLGFRATVYPNPASDFINFSIELKQATELTIQLYTLSGSLLTEVESGNYAEGVHKVSWDCSSLASGAYIFKIIASGKEFMGVINIIR